MAPPGRRSPSSIERARSLRKGDNMAEAVIWNELKAKRLGGFKFARQVPIGPYYADFVCREHRLVIELDGSQHADSAYDRRRDAFMREQGYSVLRVWSHEALKQTRSVCETILAALDGRLSEDVIARDLRFVFVPRVDKAGRVAEMASPSPSRPSQGSGLDTCPPLRGGEELDGPR